MLARFVWEIHAWAIPLTFVTGWVIGFVHFRNRLQRNHLDLYEEWRRRTGRSIGDSESDREDRQK